MSVALAAVREVAHKHIALSAASTSVTGNGRSARKTKDTADVLEPTSCQARVNLCLERLEKRLAARGDLPERLGFLQALDQQNHPRVLPLVQVGAIRSSQGGHGCTIFAEKGPYHSSQSLSELARTLAPQGFMRTDRQWLIRVDAVTEVKQLPNRLWELEVKHCPQKPRVSRQRTKTVFRALASVGLVSAGCFAAS